MLPPGTFQEQWRLDDPARAAGSEEEIMAQFRASRDEIRQRVAELIEPLNTESEAGVQQ
jgi:arsenate reductase